MTKSCAARELTSRGRDGTFIAITNRLNSEITIKYSGISQWSNQDGQYNLEYTYIDLK